MESLFDMTRLICFFFNDTATTEIYTLSLHDALPILSLPNCRQILPVSSSTWMPRLRSEEHTSELQSPCNLVCRLLLEKKDMYRCLPRTRASLHKRMTASRWPCCS